MNARQPLERVVVAGTGVTAALACLALRRALPGASVTLLAAPADPAALADRLPAMFPSARAVAAERIGLDEDALVAAGLANRRFADSFADWGGATWLRPFGEPGGSVGPGAFHQYWLDAARRGRAAPYHHHCSAARIALGTADDSGGALPGNDHALRLDPDRFLRWSARQLAAARIAVPPAVLAGVRTDDAGVAAVLLADGTAIAADLFVDCTGPAALLHAACDAKFEAWPELRCDRVLLASGTAGGSSAADRYTALPIGWRASIPLPERTVELLAWTSDRAAEGRARRLFGHGASAEAVAIRPGRRPSPFTANVVAIGDAAVQLGPLAGCGMTMALGALDLLLELLPGRPIDEGERREFNRRTRLQAERMRDFAVLPIVAAGRADGPFWAERGQAMPDSLATLLTQFRRRGSVARPEEDLLELDDWYAALLGLGLVPEVPNPVTAAAEPATIDRALAAIAGRGTPDVPLAVRR